MNIIPAGYKPGGADVAVADGGTGASTARGAAANLGVPYLLGKSFVSVSGAADTNENTLATITVPANAMGANGAIRVWTLWTVNNNANSKTARVRFGGIGGTQYMVLSLASTVTQQHVILFGNRNAANSQVGFNSGIATAFGITTGAVTTSAIDTTSSTTIVITAQKGTGSDTMTLEAYLVELLSDGT